MPRDRLHVRRRRSIREGRLRELGYESYQQYLQSRHWRSLRERYRGSDLPQACILCDADDTVDLHHKTYERIGEEELTDLVPLCRRCHVLGHVLERRGEIDLDFTGLTDEERAALYAEARAASDGEARRDFNGSRSPDPVGYAHQLLVLLTLADEAGVDVTRQLHGLQIAMGAMERKLGLSRRDRSSAL